VDSGSARDTSSPRQFVRGQAENNKIETHRIDEGGSKNCRVTLDNCTANTLDPSNLKQYT